MKRHSSSYVYKCSVAFYGKIYYFNIHFNKMIAYICFWVGEGRSIRHSAIFQLYSDETVVQFPNLHLLPGGQRHGSLKRSEPTPTWAPGRPKTSLTSMPSEGPHTVRVCQESNPGLQIIYPARYSYAISADQSKCQTICIYINILMQIFFYELDFFWHSWEWFCRYALIFSH